MWLPQFITLRGSNCRGGPPWPPLAKNPRWGGHGGPPLQLLIRNAEPRVDRLSLLFAPACNKPTAPRTRAIPHQPQISPDQSHSRHTTTTTTHVWQQTPPANQPRSRSAPA